MGGEKLRCMCTCVWTWGSPPRGRGKAFIRMGAGLAAGITPAWAGKRSWVHSICRFPQDHPRVGGEKPAVAAHVRAQLGSPPRGRGKAVSLSLFWSEYGITPAWAGKSFWFCRWYCLFRDHPRVGGEKRIVSCDNAVSLGSPPRGRGKVVLHCGVLLDVGITPAWAGKSDFLVVRVVQPEDHPRVGGEKYLTHAP